jgi:hypothetical protein
MNVSRRALLGALAAAAGPLLAGRVELARAAPVDPMALRGVIRAPIRASIPRPDWNQVLASLQVLLLLPGETGLVQNGSTLYNGDQIELHVQVGQAAWVYLLRIDSQGETERLYPAPGEPAQVQPGTDQRIPADRGFALTMDDHPGIERLVLIASTHPLGPAERRLLARLNAGPGGPERASPRQGRAAAARRPPAEASDPHPGPSRATETLRGVSRGRVRYGVSGRAIDVASDATGVAVAVLQYRHLSAPY